MNPPAEPRAVPKNRIALVHHNALLREGLCHILESGGFAVVWQGGSGTAIADRLNDCSPDVALLEWEAPGVAAELVRELVELDPGPIVVVMTRPDTADDLSEALNAGAAGCLSANMTSGDFLLSLKLLAHGDILVSHEMVPAVTSASGGPDRHQDVLTARETQILRALGRGATNQEIAQELLISPHTVKIHVRRVLAKMQFRNRQQAAAYAAHEGLV